MRMWVRVRRYSHPCHISHLALLRMPQILFRHRRFVLPSECFGRPSHQRPVRRRHSSSPWAVRAVRPYACIGAPPAAAVPPWPMLAALLLAASRLAARIPNASLALWQHPGRSSAGLRRRGCKAFRACICGRYLSGYRVDGLDRRVCCAGCQAGYFSGKRWRDLRGRGGCEGFFRRRGWA